MELNAAGEWAPPPAQTRTTAGTAAAHRLDESLAEGALSDDAGAPAVLQRPRQHLCGRRGATVHEHGQRTAAVQRLAISAVDVLHALAVRNQHDVPRPDKVLRHLHTSPPRRGSTGTSDRRNVTGVDAPQGCRGEVCDACMLRPAAIYCCAVVPILHNRPTSTAPAMAWASGSAVAKREKKCLAG